MKGQTAKVFITPGGGHGSSHIGGRLKAISRPDQAFKTTQARGHLSQFCIDVEDLVLPRQQEEWTRLTGMSLVRGQTVETHLLRLLQTTDRWVVLSGACCAVRPFLTRNKIKATCLIRHPADAYYSFFHNQHPEIAEIFGGFESIGAIAFWGSMWNNIVKDFHTSNNPVWRYESLRKDNGGLIPKAALRDWRAGRRSHADELRTNIDELLFQMTKAQFYKSYASWSGAYE